ncbi:hypothetical protein I312_106593 [Cryptococcus bacillisporus CA1280]|uniref:uncharacterized protein n=1 Tax=Cryptococcus bacillisporus CA1280 TaxID=1296109 RepID=UPI003367FCBB
MKVASEACDMRMALGEGRKRGGNGGWIGNHGAPCEMMRDGPESSTVEDHMHTLRRDAPRIGGICVFRWETLPPITLPLLPF